MDEIKHKHKCKFCFKTFPCGRSLGGHMRSHLITISSSQKKLPPMPMDVLVDNGYGLRENPTKTLKFSNKSEQDSLLDHHGEKHCKQCGKAFQSWKALFGHMKCHPLVGKSTICVDDDDDHDHHDSSNILMDDQSDNEASIPLCKRKRSERTKRYTTTTTTTTATTISSSLSTIANSEIDQQEQEEVALSLILLSMDVGCMNSVVGSSSTSSHFLEPKKMVVSSDDFLEIRRSHECEVNSPRRIGLKSSHFGSDTKMKMKKKKKSKLANSPCGEDEMEKKSTFRCIICKKAFPSYQALGGHRASHKKYKGCCAPNSENNTLDQNENVSELEEMGLEGRGGKDHECPICSKVFSSGQALGGHKRSHLTNHNSTTETRDFLDLNMPAPVEEEEEEINDFKPWWIGSSHDEHHLGFLFTS